MRILWYRASISLFMIFVLLNAFRYLCLNIETPASEGVRTRSTVVGLTNALETFRHQPFLFIGGFPRSGTTLLRVILDSHPQLSCGPETRILPAILRLGKEFSTSGERARLAEAGISSRIVDFIFLSTISEIKRSREITITRRKTRTVSCFKDPFVLRYINSISKTLPNSRFILVVRDGRAVTHSIWKRKIRISGLNSSDVRSILQEWSHINAEMVEQCLNLRKRCLVLHYENLVQSARASLYRVMNFLRLPWNIAMLKHWESIDEIGGTKLSRLQPSYSQVLHPIYNSSLYKWLKLPKPVLMEASKIAPMLEVLGYPTQPLSHDYSKLLKI